MTSLLTWEAIAESLDFDAVVNELGINVTETKRGEHTASCPLPSHPGADATPSFGVNADKLVWNCFTCGEGGAIPSLVIALLGFESDEDETAWHKALEWLLPYSDLSDNVDEAFLDSIQRYLGRAEARPKRMRRETLPTFSPRALEALKMAPVAMFEKWGITRQSVIDHFGIRYDPERVRIKGDKEYVGPAIIIPHRFQHKLVGYQERWMADDVPKWIPKYTNSNEFPRKDSIFNWDPAVFAARDGEPIIVVESVMTAIRLFQLNKPAVATFGASVSDTQLRYLSSLFHVILSFDNDPDFQNAKGKWVPGAGSKALREVAGKLNALLSVEIVPPVASDKGDLADLSDDQIIGLIDARKPFNQIRIDRLSNRR